LSHAGAEYCALLGLMAHRPRSRPGKKLTCSYQAPAMNTALGYRRFRPFR